MVRWASYAIVGVKYNHRHSQIDIVKRRPDLDSELGDETIERREEIIRDINDGYTHVTAYRENGKWIEGEAVNVVTLGGVDFIRTGRNNTRSDNLGNLPEF